MKWRHRLQVFFLALLMPAVASGAQETNFSQYPGFSEYFSKNPPPPAAANPEERSLLTRFRPRFLLPERHPGLVDFYRDYISNGSIFDGEGTFVSAAVTQELLNRFKSDARAEFRHAPPNVVPPKGVVFGRIDRARVEDPDGNAVSSEDLVFLTYHAVFRRSGLPGGLRDGRQRF